MSHPAGMRLPRENGVPGADLSLAEVVAATVPSPLASMMLLLMPATRSEERRVGKECTG
jgi:hypothetical protein